jgi:hypothetical protein
MWPPAEPIKRMLQANVFSKAVMTGSSRCRLLGTPIFRIMADCLHSNVVLAFCGGSRLEFR